MPSAAVPAGALLRITGSAPYAPSSGTMPRKHFVSIALPNANGRFPSTCGGRVDFRAKNWYHTLEASS